MKFNLRLVVLTAVMLLVLGAATSSSAFGVKESPSVAAATEALKSAMNKLGTTPDQAEFMVLTNAGFGQVDGKTSEAYLDVVTKVTGRTPGTGTLLTVRTPYDEPLWFALFNSKTKDMAFIKAGPDGYGQQSFNTAPEQIFQPDAWAAAAKGLIGKRMFSVVSITLCWDEGADWTMLKGAELHDHFCPGLNSGFIVKAFMDKELPLRAGDRYVFVGAPPNCGMDALQSAYGCTAGKKGVFTMLVHDAAKKAAKNGVAPYLIGMRVNAKKKTCDGVVIGLDWNKLGAATGVARSELSPKGGKSNPLFYITRAKMSRKLVMMPMKDKLVCIAEQGRFTGSADLVNKVVNAGADPYAVLPK